ncbi:MAG: TIGR03790 family protein, partial [Planctomycetes bacterium]|nr:TIGR03790 family protein [Planctomycetota bacterium]
MAKSRPALGLWIPHSLVLGAALIPGAARIPAEPLGPEHVLVVSNANVKASGEIAARYARARGIPEMQIVAIDAPDATDVSREVFDEKIRAPIERAIAERKLEKKIRALAMIYGVPMKVGAPRIDPPPDLPEAEKKSWLERTTGGVRRGGAAVDSELALLFRERKAADLFGFERNPAFGREDLPDLREVGITIVGRIDGPTPEIAMRLIDDAIAAERDGLAGKAYFDGRWESFGKGPVGYAAGDWFIRSAYIHARNAGFEAVLDERGDLFEKGGCPDCALYYGWYSLHNFRDHFGTLARGAIAIHIASAEGGIKFGGGRGPDAPNEGGPWCLGLLRAGAAVTAGPLGEPYLSAFPQGFVFYREIFCGRTVCEAYWLSIPWVSWQMHVIGDPLYAPFRAKPREGFVF